MVRLQWCHCCQALEGEVVQEQGVHCASEAQMAEPAAQVDPGNLGHHSWWWLGWLLVMALSIYYHRSRLLSSSSEAIFDDFLMFFGVPIDDFRAEKMGKCKRQHCSFHFSACERNCHKPKSNSESCFNSLQLCI